MQAYHNSREHIFDELRLLYLRLRARIEREKEEQAQTGHNEYRGLVLSEGEIVALLQSLADGAGDKVTGESKEAQGLLSEVKTLENEIAARLKESLEQGVWLSLYEIEKRFELTPFDTDVIVLCLAPELDLNYERLYSYLQNDITSKRPTIDMVFRLFCETMGQRVRARARFTGQAPLFRHQLVSLNGAMPLQLWTIQRTVEGVAELVQWLKD